MVGGSVKTNPRGLEKSALELLEEAVHLLQRRPWHFLLPYYGASLPFFAGLLYFWTDMSTSAFAEEYCPVASLGLALLFILMKCGQSLFAATLRKELLPEKEGKITWGRIMGAATAQALLQATGLFILPMAFILAAPSAWAYAFYQNVTVAGFETDGSASLGRRAWDQARLWPGQNHILLGIFSLFGFFVFADVTVTLLLIPQALKTLLGIDTRFTLNIYSLLNTTFLAVAVSLTHLCLDPLIKTVYVLRCYYGASLKTGEDLLMDLKAHTRARAAAVALPLTILCCLGPSVSCYGNPPATASVSAAALDASIQEVMQGREFAWRTPLSRPAEQKQKEGFWQDVLDWLAKSLKAVFRQLEVWWQALLEWLDKLLPEPEPPETFDPKDPLNPMGVLLYLLLTILACILGVMLWRLRKKAQAGSSGMEPVTTVPVLDLNNESLKADLLSSAGWLEMAARLLDQGELRTALRAMYLATLAQLGHQGLIHIARHKSNRDYLTELRRRRNLSGQFCTGFQDQTRIFEQVWYGMYSVTKDQVALFAEQQQQLLRSIQHA